MKLFIFFCFFHLLAAQISFNYGGYLILADKKKWLNSREAFNDYKVYCNGPRTTSPSLLPEITPSDCDTSFGTKIDTVRCIVTSTTPVKILTTVPTTTTPQTSTEKATEQTTFNSVDKMSTLLHSSTRSTVNTNGQTDTSTEASITSPQSKTSSSYLTEEDRKSTSAATLPLVRETTKTTQKSISKNSYSSETLLQSQSSTLFDVLTQSDTTTNNFATKKITKSATPFIQEIPTSTQNDQTSLTTIQSSTSKYSTAKYDVSSSSVTSSKLTEKSTFVSTELISKVVTVFSTTSSPSTVNKETSSKKYVSSTIQTKQPNFRSSQKSMTTSFSDIVATVSSKSNTKTSTAAEQSSARTDPKTVVTKKSTKKETTKATTNAITKYVTKEDRKSTLIHTSLKTHVSTSTPSPTSSTTSTNQHSTVSPTRTNDKISFTTVISASVFATTEMPTTTTTQNTPTSTTTKSKAMESKTDESRQTNFPNEITESQSSIVTSKSSETQKSAVSTHFATAFPSLVDYPTTIGPSTITLREADSVLSTEMLKKITSTTESPMTKMGESTEEPTTVAPTTTSTNGYVIDRSTTVETQMLPTTTVSESSVTEIRTTKKATRYITSSSTTATTTAKPSTAAKTTMRLEATTTAVTTTVEVTADNLKTTQKMIEETLTSFVSSTSTAVDKTTTELETTTQTVISQPSTPKITEPQTSPRITTKDTTLSITTPPTTANDVKQSTATETKQADLVQTTTDIPSEKTSQKSTTKIVHEETNTATIIASTLKPTSTPPPSTSTAKSSTTSSTSTTKKPSSKSTTKVVSSTTPSPSCKTACRFGFYESEFACYKLIQPKKAEGWKYKDFEATCNSFNGVIATFNDFGFTKNMELFKRIIKSKKMQVSLVFTNAILTKDYIKTRMVAAIDFSKMNATNVQIIGLSSRKTHLNVSAVCRVGKFCEEYTCPIREYFMSDTARYFATNVSSNAVLKSGQSLNIQCFGTPKRIIQASCDSRGFLVPDSSLVPCEKPEIQFEADGIVESCVECSENHTKSCQAFKNGSFYCNCSDMYFGKTCKYFNNACENVLCQNGGTCVNEYANFYCHCQSSYFGSFCQYDFYATDGIAWTMRAIANAAVVVVIVEEVVRQRQKYVLPPSGKHGTLPTEVCRFYATMMGSLAFVFKILLEFPESGKLEAKYECQTYFEFIIFFIFFSLTGMLLEAAISLGVIKNTFTNQFKGHRKNRRNCINLSKLFLLISLLGMAPAMFVWQYSGELVTPRSCIGTIPWENSTPAQQFAALVMLFLISIYALTASAIGLFARNFVDHNNFATRRRYDADSADPFAYGREILPIENNVRYYLLALRPIFFAMTWYSMIISTEMMTKPTTAIATVLSTIYSVINLLQNTIAFKKDLESLINRGILYLPKSYAPAMSQITLHCREDYLRIFKPGKLANEETEAAKERDEYLLAVRYASCTRSKDFVLERAEWISAQEIRYPIQYNQQIDILLMEDRNSWLENAALREMFPAGLKALIQKQWTLVYLKARAVGRPRSEAMAVLWQELQPPRLNRYGYRRSIFVDMFKVFWRNMVVYDQLESDVVTHRQIIMRIFRIGVKMLEIKPYKRFQRAEVLDPESSDGGTVTFQRKDPLMNVDQQQAAFDKLEELCHSISYQMMQEDEAHSRALVAANPHLYGIQQDILNLMVFNNYPHSLLDFMLDERRPNFVGPRTFWNLLAPGIDKLTHTAYYWRLSNIETWRRMKTRAHLAFAVQIRRQYEEMEADRPWNWWFWNNQNENVPVAGQPQNPEDDDDLHVEDPIGLN